MPWIGYFDKMDRADVFVYLDNVQFRKNEFQNRNKIKTSQGWQWLTVPVSYNFPASIEEVKIQNNLNWKRKHLGSIQTNYQKALYFDKYYQDIFELYAKDYEFLFEINIDSAEDTYLKANFMI